MVAEASPYPDYAETHEADSVMEYQGVEIVDGPEDVDYTEMSPKPATFSDLTAPPKETFPFRLTHTGMKRGKKITAEVKLVNLTDRATLKAVPGEIREMVMKLFFSGAGNQRGRKQEKETPQMRMDRQLQRMKDVGYAYGVAGFVNPQLVMNMEYENPNSDPPKVHVSRIDLADLTAFARICEGDDELAARQLEDFSG